MSDPIHAALIGFGKMGKAVSEYAPKFDVVVSNIISSESNTNGDGIRKLQKEHLDILIDFTSPDSVLSNIKAAANRGLSMVVGTTGWYDHLHEVEEIVRTSGIGLFYASNFSVGMHIIFRLVRQTVGILNNFPEYDIYIHELHHAQKADSPSGTAHTLGSIILETSDRKKKIRTGPVDDVIDPTALHISSTRAGAIVGTHRIGFDSEVENIELIHTAKSRMGFAFGALRAARWMKGKKGLYTMEDLLQVTEQER
jgi:4-hydroxy-tetrahydrodipicolinate reductase